ncbi:MAG: hypothetical protein SFY67_00155 [Candidatus Melainabacteria bacterium]|nr:hypothetical protein [Candidatus Melainabacteria bacterium]
MKKKQLPNPEIIRELEWIANSFLMNGQIEAAEQILEEVKHLRRKIRAARSRERRTRNRNFEVTNETQDNKDEFAQE